MHISRPSVAESRGTRSATSCHAVSLDHGNQRVLNASSCILEVQSVIVPDAPIFRIHRAHADAVTIVATKVRL